MNDVHVILSPLKICLQFQLGDSNR